MEREATDHYSSNRLGGNFPTSSSRQEVHHCFIALLHGKQLKDLRVSAYYCWWACMKLYMQAWPAGINSLWVFQTKKAWPLGTLLKTLTLRSAQRSAYFCN